MLILEERTEEEYLEGEESQRALFLKVKSRISKRRFINCIMYYSEVSGNSAEKRPLVGNSERVVPPVLDC